MTAPDYPGYKASACNGCGLCCLTVPCAVSAQFGLWRKGRCRALRFTAGRYWCDAILNPRRVSVRLAKIPKSVRLEAMGIDSVCDHRAAWSQRAALDRLAERNIADELARNPGDTYPRSCVWHCDDGTTWVITIHGPDQPPVKQRCIDGLPHGEELPVVIGAD